MTLALSMTCARLSWSEEGVTVHGLNPFAGERKSRRGAPESGMSLLDNFWVALLPNSTAYLLTQVLG